MVEDDASTGVVVVLGAAGGTGRQAVAQAVAAGWQVRAGVRRPGSAEPLPIGAVEVAADVAGSPEDLVAAFDGADAIICAVGAQGAAAQTVDAAGVAAAAVAAQAAGVDRFVLVSSMFADRPEDGPFFLCEVLQAKHVGEQAVMNARLDWTIIRPGGLIDAPGTGQVAVSRSATTTTMGMIPRDDVAAVALACLTARTTVGVGLDVVSGGTPIDVALADI